MSEPDVKKRKPNYYMPKKNRKVLEPGQRGFLCSCNFREKECVRESYNILNTYADMLYKKTGTRAEPTALDPESEDKDERSDSSDIENELQKEIDELKGSPGGEKRFQAVDSGAKNFIFIRTTLEDPVELVQKVISDIIETKQQKTRFLLRLVPIEVTCRAAVADVKESAQKLVDKHFSGEPRSFAIHFNHRNNNQVKRDELIKEIAALVSAKSDKHSVDLKNPDLSILVEVIRGVCLMSVVPGYLKHKKYNLLAIAESMNAPPPPAAEELSAPPPPAADH